MCGIVGAVAERNVVDILVDGLKRLEYRGYDSAGVAVVDAPITQLGLSRTVGKVAELEAKIEREPPMKETSALRTRAGQHTAASPRPTLTRTYRADRIAVIHNGIIENFQPIKDEMLARGYEFDSETDTEVAAHLVHDFVKQGMDLRRLRSVRR